MTQDNLELDIAVQSPEWTADFPNYQDHIEVCLSLILTEVPDAKILRPFQQVELSILLGNDLQIKQLNRDYRGKDQPTNVLSFPSLEDVDLQYMPSEIPIALGDIAFAYETISREAQDQNKKFTDHFCHLCLHGLLHLLGYDHIEDDEAEEMEALEKALLSKLSIDDPY